MNDSQIFLIYGLALLLIGSGSLIRPGSFEKLLADYTVNRAVLFLHGIFALIIGSLMVMFHNIWIWDWTVIITIIGWLALIKGALILLLPDAQLSIMKRMLQWKNLLKIYPVIMVAFGLLLVILSLGGEPIIF